MGEVSGFDAYTNKKGEPAASCNVNASAVAITNVRQKNGGQQGYGAQGGYQQRPQGYSQPQNPASDPWANGGSGHTPDMFAADTGDPEFSERTPSWQRKKTRTLSRTRSYPTK